MKKNSQILVQNKSDTQFVKVNSSILHSENKIALNSKLIWFKMLHRAYPKLNTNDRFEITIKELMEYIGWTDSNNTTSIKNYLQELTDCKLEMNLFSKDDEIWEIMPLLAGCQVRRGTGIVTYAFSPFLKDRLVNPAMYAKIDLLVSKQFKSKHTFAIYCVALDYLNLKNNYGEKKISIEDLRKVLGLEEDEYKRFADLNRRIIKPSLKEINNNSDISLDIDIVTKNRKTSHIKLKMSVKQKYLGKYSNPRIVTSDTYSGEYTEIKFENNKLDNFFSKYSISIRSKEVQNKLNQLNLTLKEDLEEYLLYLGKILEVEESKRELINPAGLYISFIKEDKYLDNFLNEKGNEIKKESELAKLREKNFNNSLKNEYEKYLISDFSKYLKKNLNSLAKEIDEISIEIKNDYVKDRIIINGKFNPESIKNRIVLLEFYKYRDKLAYQDPLSFKDWKKEYISNPENKKTIESFKQDSKIQLQLNLN